MFELVQVCVSRCVFAIQGFRGRENRFHFRHFEAMYGRDVLFRIFTKLTSNLNNINILGHVAHHRLSMDKI